MMRRKSSKGRRNKAINPSSNQTRREEKVIVERVVHKVQESTPTKSPEYYLQDERWDILPKTDYTYARSGSYSPRFIGRKYVNPNMSRYRIRGRRSGVTPPLEQEDLYYDEFTDYSEDDGVGGERELDDSDSDTSYERVLEDGIELRSGKNLKTMREILHEHDSKLQQSDIINSSSRMPYTTSKLLSVARSRRDFYNENENAHSKSTSKKDLKSRQNQKQYSQSEQKHNRGSTVNVDSRTGAFIDHSSVRSRRSLNRDFDAKLQQVSHQKQSTSRGGNVYTVPNDEVDSGPQGYSVRSIRKTVTEEYEDLDSGLPEKGAIEMSEKLNKSKQQNQHNTSTVRNNIHLYGLDSEGEFSDSETTSSRWSGYSNGSRGRYSSHPSSSSSTITTVITTVTETISTVTSPIITPVWNNVGKPVWNHVGRPITTVLTSILYAAWLLVSQPIKFIVTSTGQLFSWFWRQTISGEIADSITYLPEWLWSKIEYVSLQFVLLDAWLFRRRRSRGCCLCLPLLLLLPLLFALMTGVDVWSEKSAFLGMFTREKQAPQIVVNENSEYFKQLNDEVGTMILQLQSNSKSQLTVADVETIVYRILGKETASLKANIEGSKNEEQLAQMQWKAEQEVKLSNMQKHHDNLITNIQNLELTIANQKTVLADQGEEMKTESTTYLAGLEEKLAALQAELRALEADYAALVARVNACCHNETYYAAAVKENVNTILAEMMAGHMSGNPSQDAFTDWLHSHYVSRDVLDERLKDLASELTTSVLAMIKNLQDTQQKQYAEQQQQYQQLHDSQQQQQQQHFHVTANGSGVGEQVHQVRQMIEEALFRYSADKTGIADFALESGGGSVVSTRCSETYHRKTALVSVFGVPLWYTSNSPRTVIQPEVNPGQCWAFRGSQGYIVIQTSTRISPTGFTLEHIPKSLAPSGEIDSAPKEFTVIGLSGEFDDVGVSLGNYTYHDEGKPMQFFPVQVSTLNKPFYLYELRIISNYGNMEYTCLYRFRIHGKPYRG